MAYKPRVLETPDGGTGLALPGSSGNILTSNGTIWTSAAPATSGTVTSVSGTTNRITSTGGGTPVIDISASYVGQSSITTVGTIASGTWQGTVIGLAYGGTNANLTASNGGIFYSTATAGAILAGNATASKMLLSGAFTPPTWSTSTIPTSAGATANKVLLSDGTNYVLSTPTFPNASATTGKFIISDGTNWIASTPTLPNVAGNSGNVLTSDGTNFTSSAPPTGSLVFLQTQTASGSTALNFTTGTATYTTYFFVTQGIQPATAGAFLLLQVSNNAGSSYISTGYVASATGILAAGTTLATTNSTAGFPVGQDAPASNANQVINSTGYIYGANIGANAFVSGTHSTFRNTDTAVRFGWFGGTVGTTGNNAFRFIMSSGNITAGTVTLYGVRYS